MGVLKIQASMVFGDEIYKGEGKRQRESVTGIRCKGCERGVAAREEGRGYKAQERTREERE